MPWKPRRAALALASVALSVACSSVTFVGGGDVSLTMTADPPSASTGQDVTFSYDAVGSILVAIIMDYGDGTGDTLDTAGAQTASGRFVHAFETPGTFSVVGTIFDNLQGSASDTVVVQVAGGD